MSARPDPPLVQLIEAGPENAIVIDGMVAAFHQHEGVNVAPGSRRASIDSLLGAPAQGRILLVRSHKAEIVGYAVLAFGFSIEFGGRDAFLDELFIAEPFRGQGIGSVALGSGLINLMQFCLMENSRMMVKKRKTRLCAFSSIFRLQASVFLQTRRAGSILPLTTLNGLENHKVSFDHSPCHRQNILPQNG